MKNATKFLTLLAVIAISSLPVVAMAAGPGFGGGVDDGGGGVCAPIDGGLSMLVAAGVGYGAKLVAANKKKKAAATENA